MGLDFRISFLLTSANDEDYNQTVGLIPNSENMLQYVIDP